MTKKGMIAEAVESLGYKPVVDNDGHICVRYQMKNIYFMIGQDEEAVCVRHSAPVCGCERRGGNVDAGCLQQGDP